MYRKILMTLGVTGCDRDVIEHIKALALLCHSEVVLLHVADGWAARRFGKDAVSTEITEDTAYLEATRAEFEMAGVPTRAVLLYGDPKREILKWVSANGCDLIAMATHGHRFIGDLIWGATASHIQHRVNVPVLLLKGKKEDRAAVAVAVASRVERPE